MRQMHDVHKQLELGNSLGDACGIAVAPTQLLGASLTSKRDL